MNAARRGILITLLAVTACGREDPATPDAAPPDAATPDAACRVLGVPQAPPECAQPVEPCAVGDWGWNLWCESGTVYDHDLTTYSYCACGSSETACTLGREPLPVLYCKAPCVDSDIHWFETNEEHNAFDPASLCAQP